MSAHQDSAVEAAARAHCDFFGGEGWWDTGLLADTKPKALEAMRVALAAMPTDTTLREQRDELLEALDRIATVDMGGGFLGAQACHKVAREALAKVRGIAPETAELPDGLYMENGTPHFDCRTCGQSTEWCGEPSEFDIGARENVCGRSPRCCP